MTKMFVVVVVVVMVVFAHNKSKVCICKLCSSVCSHLLPLDAVLFISQIVWVIDFRSVSAAATSSCS